MSPPKVSRGLRQTERQFQSAVIDYARLRGWRVFHPRPQGVPAWLLGILRRFLPESVLDGVLKRIRRESWKTALEGDRGYPDLTLARGGVVVFAELKTDGGEFREGQEDWLNALDPWWADRARARDDPSGVRPGPTWHIAACWRPVDWPKIELVLS